MNIHTYRHEQAFRFENGQELPCLEISYHTWGKLNEGKDNVIWVVHALTANSNVFDWWDGLFGDNKLFNENEHFIVCANILGSNYGTTNPLSINTETGEPFYLSFPQFSIRDMVGVQKILADHLSMSRIHTLIGGSIGGQQALEWAILEPNRFENLVLIATNAVHSPWGIAFNESQRMALVSDPTFFSNTPDGGKNGLKAARSIALLSYRNYDTYAVSQQEIEHHKLDNFKACSYQQYQGEKLVKRFNAYSYWYLSKAMDSHNIARKRDDASEVLKSIVAKTLVIGITSDLLFPPSEQRFLAQNIENAAYAEIDSLYGHDGFLIETDMLTEVISDFLNNDAAEKVAVLHKIA